MTNSSKSSLGRLLKELFTEEDSGLEERLRPMKGQIFSLRVFKSLKTIEEMTEYVESRLELLGSGSARKVFILSSKTVLKLADIESEGKYAGGHEDPDTEEWISNPRETSPEKGMAQNRAEWETYMNSKTQKILPRVYDYQTPDFFWLVSELTRPLKNWREFQLGTSLNQDDVWTIVRLSDARKEERSLPVNRRVMNNWFARMMLSLAEEDDIDPGDFPSYEQWGSTSDGRIVLLDSGGTKEVIGRLY